MSMSDESGMNDQVAMLIRKLIRTPLLYSVSLTPIHMSYNAHTQRLIWTQLAQPLFEVADRGNAGCMATEEHTLRTTTIMNSSYDIHAALESIQTDIAIEQLRVEAMLSVPVCRPWFQLPEHPDLPPTRTDELKAEAAKLKTAFDQIEARRNRMRSAYDFVQRRLRLQAQLQEGNGTTAENAHAERIQAALAQGQDKENGVAQEPPQDECVEPSPQSEADHWADQSQSDREQTDSDEDQVQTVLRLSPEWEGDDDSEPQATQEGAENEEPAPPQTQTHKESSPPAKQASKEPSPSPTRESQESSSVAEDDKEEQDEEALLLDLKAQWGAFYANQRWIDELDADIHSLQLAQLEIHNSQANAAQLAVLTKELAEIEQAVAHPPPDLPHIAHLKAKVIAKGEVWRSPVHKWEQARLQRQQQQRQEIQQKKQQLPQPQQQPALLRKRPLDDEAESSSRPKKNKTQMILQPGARQRAAELYQRALAREPLWTEEEKLHYLTAAAGVQRIAQFQFDALYSYVADLDEPLSTDQQARITRAKEALEKWVSKFAAE